MGKLCEATGRWPQSIHYKATAKAYVKQWTKMAMKTSDSELPHAKLAYQEENSWGLLCESVRGCIASQLTNFDCLRRQLVRRPSVELGLV